MHDAFQIKLEAKNPVVVWLTDPRRVLAQNIKADLLTQLLSSRAAVMMGAVSSLIVSSVCLAREGSSVFLGFVVAELLLMAWRFAVLSRLVRAPASCSLGFIDLPVFLSIAWCGLQGALAFFAMKTSDPVIMVLTATLIMGLLGPLCSRNYAAPRLALLLVCLCDLPFIAGAVSNGNPWMLVLAAMTPFYLVGATQIIRSYNDAMVRTLEAEYQNLNRAEQVENEKAQVIEHASYDGLTGLLNRHAFYRKVSAQLAAEPRGFVALIDLDKFKPINDLYGHDAGDIALKITAERLLSTLANKGTIGRLGGDEFAIFVHHNAPASFECQMRDVIKALQRPFEIGHRILSLGCSIGVATASSKQQFLTDILKDADAALLQAKESPTSDLMFFDDKIRSKTRRKLVLENALLDEATAESIQLVYQPIFTLAGKPEISAFEALARWDHAELGAVSPAEFIPASERLATIAGFSNILLVKAIEEARTWKSNQRVAFNLSAVQLCSPGAHSVILSTLEKLDFAPERLNLEVTETAVLANFANARENIEWLRREGCRIVLDDFGAGYSSLQYLLEIRFDKIKIDGSLIRGARNVRGLEILQGVVNLTKAVKLECVAECIETERDLMTAKLLGCDYGQGYFLGRPVGQPLKHFGALCDALAKVA